MGWVVDRQDARQILTPTTKMTFSVWLPVTKGSSLGVASTTRSTRMSTRWSSTLASREWCLPKFAPSSWTLTEALAWENSPKDLEMAMGVWVKIRILLWMNNPHHKTKCKCVVGFVRRQKFKRCSNCWDIRKMTRHKSSNLRYISWQIRSNSKRIWRFSREFQCKNLLTSKKRLPRRLSPCTQLSDKKTD